MPFSPFEPRATVISADPCTGARKKVRSGADSPRGIDHGQSDGARVPLRWSKPLGAIGRSRRTGSVLASLHHFGPSPAVFTLRSATLHFARNPRRTYQEPHGERYRGFLDMHGGDDVLSVVGNAQLALLAVRSD